ncbi:MAG TPA: tetratricopeptide repeat protein [Acidobacteriota bacterium]|nr:tetratricopeptide repeat protein [Acidobacteriota bacterium]
MKSRKTGSGHSGGGFSGPQGGAESIGLGWIAVIVLLALSVRMIVLWQLSQNNPAFALPQVDSQWHYQWARSLAAGNWIGDGVFYRAPLYPYLLGIWFTIIGDGFWPIRILQALIGAVSAGLVGVVGARAFDRRVGITAGLIWALYGPMIYYETEFLIPVLVIPLNLIAILLALKSAGQPGRLGRWLGVGLIVGLSAIARPNILLAVPAFWLWSWVQSPLQRAAVPPRRWLAPVILTFGILIPIIPVTLHNYIVGDDAVLISYQGGVNLYLGNNPDADGVTMQMPDVRLDESVEWDEFVDVTDSVAQEQAGRTLKPSEISAHWTGKAVDYILDNPGTTLWRWLKKTYYALNGYEVGDQTNIYTHTQYSSLLAPLVNKTIIYFPFGLIGALAFFALPRAWRDPVRTRPLILFAVLYVLTVVPFLATARHRLPFAVVMVIFAAVGFWSIWTMWRKRVWMNAGVATVGVIILIVALNRPTTEHLMFNPAFDLYQQALVLDKRGEFYEAIGLYEEAIRIEPRHLASRLHLAYDLVRVAENDSAIAASFEYMRYEKDNPDLINNMGHAYLGMGDTVKAKASWRIAARIKPSMPQPFMNLAELSLAQGEVAEAVNYYRGAITADSTYTVAYNNLAMIYAKAGNFDQAIYLLRAVTRHVPDHATSWANLGAVLLDNNKAKDAIEPLNRALELNPQLTEIRFNLAVAYLGIEDPDNAVAQLNTVLEKIPDHPQARALLERIEAVRRGEGPPP